MTGKNVGGADRAVRVAVGFALLVAIPVIETPLRWIGLFGLVPLLTGLFGYCPLYSLIGLSTCPR